MKLGIEISKGDWDASFWIAISSGNDSVARFAGWDAEGVRGYGPTAYAAGLLYAAPFQGLTAEEHPQIIRLDSLPTAYAAGLPYGAPFRGSSCAWLDSTAHEPGRDMSPFEAKNF